MGFDFHLDTAHAANTLAAHRLLHLAASHGRQAEAKERLMRAYFTEGVNLNDHDELVRLAVESGLEAVETARVLASDQFGADVEADFALARGFGITGVPFFVFDRTYGVSGAQESAVLAETLERAWSDAHPLTLVPAGGSDASGMACEGDTCAV